MIDYVLSYLRSQSDAPVLIDDYCRLNFSMSWDELQRNGNYPESVAETLDLIEEGELKVVTPGSALEQ